MENKPKAGIKAGKSKYAKISRRKHSKGRIGIESPEVPQYGSTM